MVIDSTNLQVASPASAPKERTRLVLVGNYPPDAQESMLRFAQVMRTGLRDADCDVEVVQPPTVFGRWVRTTSGFGKWLGYFDKYVIFPVRLRRVVRRKESANSCRVIVHICDHSNAIYTSWLGDTCTVVTCHDLLAVRGALGEETDCPASLMGRLLQKWIVRGLDRATSIVAVSHATMRDVTRIVRFGPKASRRCVVPMGLNHPFCRLEPCEVDARLASVGLENKPYILHVGSNLRRKNRDAVLRIFARVANQWNGRLVLAGEGLNDDLRALARNLGISDRIDVVSKPETPVLEALYNRALALLFPSRFEGFGWPIIEAQASGCPVICSDAGPLPEVVGDGGIVCPLEDEEAFASAIFRLLDASERDAWVRKGLANAEGYSTERMIEGYLAIYEQAARQR